MKLDKLSFALWIIFATASSFAQMPSEDDINLPKEVIAKATRATVIVHTKDGFGSGFLISTNGYLLTNYHVIEGASKAIVEFNDGQRLPVISVINYSPRIDLALLRIAPGNYECLELESPENITLGDPLFIIGHPHGHYWTLTKGYLAGKRTENNRPVIQFSADISPGNSGGPVMHLDGKVCGIATYLERQTLDFHDGKYVLDPSGVLKFGVAVDAFSKTTNTPPQRGYTLAQIAQYNEKLVTLDLLCAVIDRSNDLLVDLHGGIKDLRVSVDRSYDYSYRKLGGGYRQTGSETIIYNYERFVKSAARLEAIAFFLNEYVTDDSGDFNIDNAVRCWRNSMNASLASIRFTLAADGKSEGGASVRAARVVNEFNKSTADMYQALDYAYQALRVYGANIRHPIVSPRRIAELREFYYSNRLKL